MYGVDGFIPNLNVHGTTGSRKTYGKRTIECNQQGLGVKKHIVAPLFQPCFLQFSSQ